MKLSPSAFPYVGDGDRDKPQFKQCCLVTVCLYLESWGCVQSWPEKHLFAVAAFSVDSELVQVLRWGELSPKWDIFITRHSPGHRKCSREEMERM